MKTNAKSNGGLAVAAGFVAVLGLVFGSLSATTVAWAGENGTSSSSGFSNNVASAVSGYQQAYASYQALLQTYNGSKGAASQKVVQANFQDAQKAYGKASQAYVQAVKAISNGFANDMSAAAKAAKQAAKTARGAEAKNQVNSALSAATAAATARRDAALAQLTPLGDAPARPTFGSNSGAGQSNGGTQTSGGNGSSVVPGQGATTQPQPGPTQRPKPKKTVKPEDD